MVAFGAIVSFLAPVGESSRVLCVGSSNGVISGHGKSWGGVPVDSK
jgi:hypothetical protein